MWLKDCNTKKRMQKKKTNTGVIVWRKLRDRWIIYFDSARRTAEYLEIPTDLPPGSILNYHEWYPRFHFIFSFLQKSEIQCHCSLLSANQIADTFQAVVKHVHFMFKLSYCCTGFYRRLLRKSRGFFRNFLVIIYILKALSNIASRSLMLLTICAKWWIADSTTGYK